MYLWKYTENDNYPGICFSGDPEVFLGVMKKLRLYGGASVSLDVTTKSVSGRACGRSKFKGYLKMKLSLRECCAIEDEGDICFITLSEQVVIDIEEAIQLYRGGMNDFSVPVGDSGIWFW